VHGHRLQVHLEQLRVDGLRRARTDASDDDHDRELGGRRRRERASAVSANENENENDMRPRRWMFEFRRGGTAHPGRIVASSRAHTKLPLRTKRYKNEGAASLSPDFDA